MKKSTLAVCLVLIVSLPRLQCEDEISFVPVNQNFPQSCDKIRQNNPDAESDVYTIYPEDTVELTVYCHMDEDDHGWVVISRRNNGSKYFTRGWTDYMNGFGSLDGEMWLGNVYIHLLTSETNRTLRLQVVGNDTTQSRIDFDFFTLDDETTNFKFYIGKTIVGQERDFKIQVKAGYELFYGEFDPVYRDISEETSLWLTYLSMTDLKYLFTKNERLPIGYSEWLDVFLTATKITMMIR